MSDAWRLTPKAYFLSENFFSYAARELLIIYQAININNGRIRYWRIWLMYICFIVVLLFNSITGVGRQVTGVGNKPVACCLIPHALIFMFSVIHFCFSDLVFIYCFPGVPDIYQYYRNDE